MTTDCNGASLREGDRVEAWWDGIAYTATVTVIWPHDPGCGDHRHLDLRRDDNGDRAESTSDSVRVVTHVPRETPKEQAR